MSKAAILFDVNQEVLEELALVMEQISEEDYAMNSPVFRSASIGQHCRHIIELYQCLLESYDSGIVCYDKRKRDYLIETDKAFALSKINDIKNCITKMDKKLVLIHQICKEDFTFQSSYFREVLYNLEHCIHHQALIKLACLELDYLHLPESFGIARSTLLFKKKTKKFK